MISVLLGFNFREKSLKLNNMKKTFTKIIAGLLTVFATGFCNAQTNLDLEVWQGASPDVPANWTALLNPYTALLGDTSVVMGGGQSGFAAKLKPVDLTMLGYNFAASFLQYGPTGGGDVFTTRPDSVQFYHMANDATVITEVGIYLTLYNSSTQVIDTIAKSVSSYSGTVDASFVFTKSKLDYDIVNGNLIPDSLKMVVTALSPVATAASHTAYFSIDEIEFKGTASIVTSLTTYASSSNIKVYPTTVNSNMNFEFGDSNYRVISIYDITGKEIVSEKADTNRHKMNLSSVESGYYIYKISDGNNRPLKTGKFVVSHN